MNNDLTFFTNEPERNLNDRFSQVLKRDTQFFDALVGYFRASGFYLLQDAIKNVEKTRILIGINTDEQILKMYKESQMSIDEINLNAYESKQLYKNQLEKEFENSEDTEIVETGVRKFIELIQTNKLEIRFYGKQPIHAKVYIMRNYNDCADYGKVITGSSNFSYSGLMNNLEFNVELKNYSDVKFAHNKFEELWKDSIDISQDCINTIKNDTWIKNDITPYEMYLKFLYEYFKEEINDDQSFEFIKNEYLIDGFKPLRYQMDAVKQANKMLRKHNGVFISDVVGLGKTYICAMLANILPGGKLFVVPPVLVDYWEKVLRSFGVRNFKVCSSGKLKRISEEKIYKTFSHVFVDEAHKFRNENTNNYKYLHEICFNKKVVLITATPQNNYITDIANQLFLFESRTNSTIPGVRKLEQFFLNLKTEVNKYEKGTNEHYKALEEASCKIRDKVLREVMIRRTRTEIQNNYKEDLEKQGLSFPKLNNPIKETYEFDEKTEKTFEETINLIKNLTYSRYKPLTYVKSEYLNSEMNSLLTGQWNMGSFMKSILVKRLESSKYAFIKTLTRFIKSHENFIKMYNNREVWISKQLNVDDLLDRDDFETLIDSKEKGNAFSFKTNEFRDDFIEDLKKDLNILTSLKEKWEALHNDCKLDYFLKLLKTDKNLRKKIIIFTESKETAEYLKKNIQDNLHKNVILFSGSMSDKIKIKIRNNFDQNVESELVKDDYNILVTTDVLAEGINLHRSNVIINYDLPWNPTKIMQRVGRINRVGTKHKELFVYNFFPTTNSDDLIHQKENIISKIQMFHNILGNDSKFLTEEENVSTHKLFDQMTTIDKEDETGLNTELQYLKLIRDIRDKQPKQFSKIQKLPKKIKIARKGKKEELLTFFRKGYVRKFYLSNQNKTDELTFDDAIEIIKTFPEEKPELVNSKYYVLLNKNKDSFDNFEKEDNQDEFSKVEKIKGKSNAKNIIFILKEAIKSTDILTDDEINKGKKLINLLQNNELPTKTLKEANKKIQMNVKSTSDIIKFYKDFSASLPSVYFELEDNRTNQENAVKEIILSELFIK